MRRNENRRRRRRRKKRDDPLSPRPPAVHCSLGATQIRRGGGGQKRGGGKRNNREEPLAKALSQKRNSRTSVYARYELSARGRERERAASTFRCTHGFRFTAIQGAHAYIPCRLYMYTYICVRVWVCGFLGSHIYPRARERERYSSN